MTLASKLESAATFCLAGCAVVMTLMFAHRELTATDPNAPQPPKEIKAWKTYAVGNMRIGDAAAPVIITEFADFQCPFCQRLAVVLDSLRAEKKTSFTLVYRNYPLTNLHPYARPAAIAAQCAANFGHFAEYHNYLYGHPDSLGHIKWTVLADRIGIADTASFAKCLSDPAIATKLLADSTAGVALHVGGTPTLMINRWVFYGAPTREVLEKYIERERNESGAH